VIAIDLVTEGDNLVWGKTKYICKGQRCSKCRFVNHPQNGCECDDTDASKKSGGCAFSFETKTGE